MSVDRTRYSIGPPTTLMVTPMMTVPKTYPIEFELAFTDEAANHFRTEEFESLAKFLPLHEAAEEAVIYPALRALGDEGTRIAEARTQEENAASGAITKPRRALPKGSGGGVGTAVEEGSRSQDRLQAG